MELNPKASGLSLIVFLILGVAGPEAQARVAGFNCIGLPDGVYPNVADCTTFYKCSNGYTYLYNCPNGLHFDEPNVRCEWPELARCPSGDCSKHRAGELHGVAGCHGHEYRDLYPDPYDCGSFYHCAHSADGQLEAHHKKCPSVLHFNDEKKICDWPANADCKSCGSSPSTVDSLAKTS